MILIGNGIPGVFTVTVDSPLFFSLFFSGGLVAFRDFPSSLSVHEVQFC